MGRITAVEHVTLDGVTVVGTGVIIATYQRG